MRDIINRCHWVNMKNPLYIQYHDEEWGVPQHDDKMLFELITLECFQAGLSWECILNKREGFRTAYDDFDVVKVSKYDDDKINSLMENTNIIRNRLKIKASINNANVFMQIQEEFGSFDAYIWGFTDGKVINESYDIRTTSPLSDKIAKDLKKRGMKFVGSVTTYAYLQSIGVINGHGRECDCCKNEGFDMAKNNFPYEDIVHLPHLVSQEHPQRSRTDRAAQFSPFAALTGHSDAIAETARLTA